MSAQMNPIGSVSPFATSTVSRISASYQMSGNGNTAKIIRKLIGLPQHSYIMQDAPRQYIRSVREAGISGSYRRGLERSESRDAVNWQHVESMHSLLRDLRGIDPAEDGGFIMVRLNSLLREHTGFLKSERFEKLEWIAQSRPEPAEAKETEAPEQGADAPDTEPAKEETRTVFTQLLKQTEPEKSESAQQTQQKPVPQTVVAQASVTQTAVAQSEVAASSGLK